MQSANEAKIICFSCPVRQACADYRDVTGATAGIWAGEQMKRKTKSSS